MICCRRPRSRIPSAFRLIACLSWVTASAEWNCIRDDILGRMARHEIISDDLDGSPGASPVTFGLEGRTYTIDLGPASLSRLREALEPFIAAAHTQSPAAVRGRTPGRTTGARTQNRDYDLTELREWAAKKKVSVPARGRVPRSVIEQYKAAGGR
jgi:hypothetical protein